MDKIFQPNSSFDFTKLSLGHPQTTKGGSYFTKLLINGESLYVQFPRCKTKQGIIQSEKNIYADLLYETAYNNELNEWLENLETACQQLLYEKNNLWFSGDIELNDIESAFTNIAKLYKSGNQFLIRCYIPKQQIVKTIPCFVYDENEKTLNLGDVDVTKEIIPLVKIDGIKFTNKSFQLELNLGQIMIMNTQEELKQCLIKPSISNKQSEYSSFSIQNNKKDIDNNHIKNNINENKDIIEKTIKNVSTIEEFIIDDNELEQEDGSNEKCETTEGECETTEGECETTEGEYETTEGEYETDEEDKCEANNTLNNYGISEVDDLDINKLNEKESNNKSTYLEKSKQNTLDQIKTNEHLELVNLNIDDVNSLIKLKKPNEVYYEIYKAAREKAKRAKKFATEAYLEAKNIKIKYMLDDLDESDEDEHHSGNY
jgi:hypothetical protein